MIINIITKQSQLKNKKMSDDKTGKKPSKLKGFLKKAFKFAAWSVPAFLALGAIDLAIWHYLPGGVALFHALREPMLNNAIATTLSNGMDFLATKLGGGIASIAAGMGGQVVGGGALQGGFIPSIGR